MKKFVVIDIETTGHSPQTNDKIIEVGIVIIENNKIVDHYSSLFNPESEIPPFISNLTGIKNEDVIDAPLFKDKAKEIIDLFQDSYLVAHNVPFDLGFLNGELSQHGFNPLQNKVLDTVELAQILFPQAASYKLGQLAEYLDLSHTDPHRALSDAYVTAELLLKIFDKINRLPYETITHLLKLENVFHSDLYALLLERQDESAFSFDDQNHIVSHHGLAFKNTPEKSRTAESFSDSYGDTLDSIYEAKGTLERHMKNYEKRPGQREMSEAVYDAFQSQQHALIEAETGTGKSLAYLIPTLYEAVKTNERAVVSTYTTQLQTQLLEEEIPLIKKLVDFSFDVAILKGKSHYLSLERFERELVNYQEDNYGIALTKAMILVWITETETGDIDEIQLPSSGYSFYQRVSTESEGYVNPRSSWFKWSYYQKARSRAQQANLIITNHALLCTDMFNEYRFLPSYNKIVVDEAHHLETTASNHYGLKLDYVKMQYTLNQIGTVDDANWLCKLIEKNPVLASERVLEQWDNLFNGTKHEIDDLFHVISQYVRKQHRNEKSVSDIGKIQYRFSKDKEKLKDWNVIENIATRLTLQLRDLIHILSLLENRLAKQTYVDLHDKEDITQRINNLQIFIDHLEHLFIAPEEAIDVKWIEMENNGAKNTIFLYSEPADISDLLFNHFFLEKESVILTSATLTMRNSFSFIQKRLGIPEDNLMSVRIASPFSYKDQVQLMVPNDFPDINQQNIDEFIYSTCEAIISLAQVTDGRMLVLFTSYDMLRRSHALLKETMDTDKYMLISQGISSGSRARLKKNFRTFERAILLGTSSFWEGVDIPGDDLSCLMIVRLPFEPPTHPVYQAKSAALKKENKNAFFELSLPNAVIRFKQGFGRLIRSTNDRGIVFICDARVVKARYGRFFTESIPDVPCAYAPTAELIKKAEKWF